MKDGVWEVPAAPHGLCCCPAALLAHGQAPPPGLGTQEVCAFLGPCQAEGLEDLVPWPLLQVPEWPPAVWPPSAGHSHRSQPARQL